MIKTPHFIHLSGQCLTNYNIYRLFSLYFLQIIFVYLLDEIFCFLKQMLPYLLKSLTPVRYLVFLLHSLPFLRFFPSFQADMRCFHILSEMSYVRTPYFDTNTSVSLYCFSHIMTLLHSHNMDTSLLLLPSLSPHHFFLYSTISSPLFQQFYDITHRPCLGLGALYHGRYQSV